MKGIEAITGYSHNFRRYVPDYDDGVPLDRLRQILQYGILSHEEAARLNIPFFSPSIDRSAMRYYRDIIFLHPSINGKLPVLDDSIAIILSGELVVLSQEEMARIKRDNQWRHASLPEVYVMRRIDQRYIRAIILPNGSQERESDVKGLVGCLLPHLVETIEVRRLNE